MAKGNVGLGDAMMGAVKSYDTAAGHTAEVSRKPKSRGAVLERVTIECTDNGGYSVDVHRTSTAAKNGYSDPGYMKPTKHVFEDRNSLDEFLDHVLGTPDKAGK